MNVVDSSAWLEYFADGPNADFFAPAIENVGQLLVPTICMLEVFKATFRQRGRYMAYKALAQMRLGRVVDLDRKHAVAAAKLGVRMKLALADSVVLAAARTHDATLWTQDEDFAGITGVKYRPKRP